MSGSVSRSPVDARTDAITAITATGKSAEQAEAFLDILGSAFRRRGWAEGEPLSEDEIGERLDTFLGEPRSETFNPAYQVARCGQLSTHAPHVVEHGPDQPRNCPGRPA